MSCKMGKQQHLIRRATLDTLDMLCIVQVKEEITTIPSSLVPDFPIIIHVYVSSLSLRREEGLYSCTQTIR